ncbi:putative OPA3-like protein CG13603 isoform X2 [Drosophila serrata]|nr:putative OPA3-like protein CG13603 isoform X2 [Drosophila serrata]
MWMLGMRQPRFVPPLNTAMSIEMGANLLGEMSIFLIGALLLTAEFYRQRRNDKSKQEEKNRVQQQLETKITDLTEKVAFQTMEIRQLKMMVGSMDRSYDCCWT